MRWSFLAAMTLMACRQDTPCADGWGKLADGTCVPLEVNDTDPTDPFVPNENGLGECTFFEAYKDLLCPDNCGDTGYWSQYYCNQIDAMTCENDFDCPDFDKDAAAECLSATWECDPNTGAAYPVPYDACDAVCGGDTGGFRRMGGGGAWTPKPWLNPLEEWLAQDTSSVPVNRPHRVRRWMRERNNGRFWYGTLDRKDRR